MGLHNIEGGRLSIIVTVVAQDDVLPSSSIPFRITVFTPRFEQLNVLLDKVKLTKLQLSELPSSMSDIAMLAIPAEFSDIVTGLHFTRGAILSNTVTTVEHDALFPEASVPDRITVLTPMLEQLKEDFDKLKLIDEQLSKLPSFISVALIDEFPLPSKLITIGLQIMVGGIRSTTFTVAEQVDESP